MIVGRYFGNCHFSQTLILLLLNEAFRDRELDFRASFTPNLIPIQKLFQFRSSCLQLYVNIEPTPCQHLFIYNFLVEPQTVSGSLGTNPPKKAVAT